MGGQQFSVWCRRVFLAGSTLAGILGTAIGTEAQALKDLQTPDTPLVLQAQGSFFVGGGTADQTEVELGNLGPAGHIAVNQMYVRFMVPQNGAGNVPVVMVHGATLTGKSWETTPDGRMGWDEYFVRKGHPVYVPDQVGRGRSGFNQAVFNNVRAGRAPAADQPALFRFSDEVVWPNFRFGATPGVPFADSQFPVSAVDELAKQGVPDVSRLLPTPNPTFKALSDLASYAPYGESRNERHSLERRRCWRVGNTDQARGLFGRARCHRSAEMILFTTAVTAIALLVAASTDAQTLVITRAGSRAVRTAPAENFTGVARVEMLFEALEPSHASGGSVTFEPGARTAWHSHPRGQILIVTAGVGRVQRWGDPIEEIRAGDVVTIPADQKHWHGASPRSAMTHIAITEHRDGTRVQWMETVSDEQYNAAARSEQQPPSSNRPQGPSRPSGEVQQRIAPGLATLTDDVLFGDVWRRPELSPRDRSLVTISVLIATGRSAVLAGHLGRALDNGVQPSEASGLLAHLAIYCGWPTAVAALDAFDQVYTARKVDTAPLRTRGPRLPAPAPDAARAKAVTEEFGAVAPKFVQLTNDVVFDDLWRRSDLSLRDRSLVTIAALAAIGDDDQLDAYVRRGLESGLTRDQITEAMTHLGFYAGWSRATKAMTAITKAFGR